MSITKQQIETISVMIIDDEPFMRKLLTRLLDEIGIKEIVTADDGADGLNKLAATPLVPSLVICDLEMPGIDGFEFVRKLRAAKNDKFKDLPVLIVTGHSDPESVKSAVNAGIHGYLAKPVSRGALEKRIATALQSGPIDPAKLSR
jgi:two-component system, chemotaxis family, chemotaxis protein CheY